MDERSARVIKNTLFLYLRMILLLAISLYTSRVVLANLGVSDFGLYNVVGGLISIFTFINNSMAQSSQRYITFYLGKGDFSLLRIIFSQSFLIHLVLGIAILILIETAGIWYFYNMLVIEPGREFAAMVIFQVSACVTFLNILVVPFRAAIVSHEKMSTFAYISILEAIMKLVIAIIISMSSFDKLIVYGILMFVITFFISALYGIYALRHFEETGILFGFKRKMLKEMFSFAGWSLFGSLAAAGYSQGLNLLLNVFFNTTINAARGLSLQIQSVVRNFASSFMMAVNPQITKSYASQDLDYFYKLIYKGSNYSFYLFLCIACPVFWGIDFFLSVWLLEVPPHTGNFIRIMLLISCVEILATPLNVAIQATGKNKYFEISVGIILMLIVPLSYIALKIIIIPEVVFVVDFLCVLFAHTVRVFISHSLYKLPYFEYLKNVIFRILMVLLCSSIVPLYIYFTVSESIINCLFLIITAFISTCISVMFIGLSFNERNLVLKTIQNKILYNNR